MNSTLRSAAILTGPQTHLDHIGILSDILQIPLIVTEDCTYQAAKNYYPQISCTLKGLEELSIEYLAQNFEVLFETGKFWAAELLPFFKLLFNKQMRFVFCPHGNSDKGRTLSQHVEQDISLVYGDHLKDLLSRTGAESKIKHLVRTGNYRYSYYLEHQSFYDDLVQKNVLDHFHEKKRTLLYAPTWQDRENPTSFFYSIDKLIEQLSSDYNLILKLHPFLIEDNPAQVFQILSHYKNHPSLVFLTDFPPIYPILAACDLYIGDYSSIGYDFLAFDKPLYFLTPNQILGSSLLDYCGLNIPKESYRDLNSFITNTFEKCSMDFQQARKKVYSYAFGEQLSFIEIKKSIFEKLF